MPPAPFVPPPYPHDRLDAFRRLADAVPGGVVDCSIGNPVDPVPEFVLAALAEAAPLATGYPATIGSPAFRAAASGWIERRLGVELAPEQVLACVGTKELVVALSKSGVEVDGKQIHLHDKLKKLGKYQIDVRLHKNVAVEVTLEIINSDPNAPTLAETMAAASAPKADADAKDEKPAKADKAEKGEKSGKGDKAEKSEKSGKGDKSDKADRAEKGEKSEKSDKPKKTQKA